MGHEVSCSASWLTPRAAARDPLQTIKDATNSITSLSLPGSATPNAVGAEIISSSLDGHVRTHDLRMGKVTEDLVGSPVHCVLPSPQTPKDTYMAASADAKIRIFDRANGAVLQTLEGHRVGEGRIRACWGYGESTVDDRRNPSVIDKYIKKL
jgi:mitogen-activated protein kinase organizer 1